MLKKAIKMDKNIRAAVIKESSLVLININVLW
jgi:hypothetical protein